MRVLPDLDTSEIGQSPCEQCAGALSLYTVIVASCVLAIRNNQATIQPHSLPLEANGVPALEYIQQVISTCPELQPPPPPGAPCTIGPDDPDGVVLAATRGDCTQLISLTSRMVAPLDPCDADLSVSMSFVFPTTLIVRSVCMTACGECAPTAPVVVQVNVQITTFDWANEISWNVDGGSDFPSQGAAPYANNSVNDQVLDLSVGDHTLNYFDSYGDGWHGGYWTLIDPTSGALMAGGDTVGGGRVVGAGGSEEFTLGAGGAITAAAQVAITVHIHTITWANEITWNIDSGSKFGVTPPFDDNSEFYEAMVVSPGDHMISYYDAYGDGWHGGYWEILPGSLDAGTAAGVSPIAGGPVDGQVTLSGGDSVFTLSALASDQVAGLVAANAQINVQITTFDWANEISWNVDGGTTFPDAASPYNDNSVNDQVLDLSVGDHTLNYFDSYGDGWHGGYWSLINPVDSTTLAGGPTSGVVAGAGGQARFNLVASGSGALVGGTPIPMTVHIHTVTWADEITWQVDSMPEFGLVPALLDNSDYYEVLMLAPGQHTIDFFDAYGDGWHGGYWEVLPGRLDAVFAGTAATGVTPVAGGPILGAVAGFGGSAAFVAGSGGTAASAPQCTAQCVVGFQCPVGQWWDDAAGLCVATQAACGGGGSGGR